LYFTASNVGCLLMTCCFLSALLPRRQTLRPDAVVRC
jgi:hypothetical protein